MDCEKRHTGKERSKDLDDPNADLGHRGRSEWAYGLGQDFFKIRKNTLLVVGWEVSEAEDGAEDDHPEEAPDDKVEIVVGDGIGEILASVHVASPAEHGGDAEDERSDVGLGHEHL